MTRREALRRLAAALTAAAAAPAASQLQQDAPYVPTPDVVVAAMLGLARVGKDDFVVDLGSGDGRIVITAARQFGARGLGVEIDSNLVAEARRQALSQGVAERVAFVAENVFITDFRKASVLTMYLGHRMNLQLRPALFEQLRPGARVVSHDFDMGNWRPDAQVRVKVPDKPYGPPVSDIYLWIMPANAAGTWQWRLEAAGTAVPYELALEQTFQSLAGRALAAGRAARLAEPGLTGSEVRFVLYVPANGRELRHEYTGRVSGEAITGRVRLDGGAEVVWNAQRVRRGSIAQPPEQ